MSYKTLSKLSLHLQQFTEWTDHKFGKYPIIFLGDFCQLECIGKDCIFHRENSIYWEQALTHMVELKGTHRYAKCPTMREIMPKMRENGLSEEARKILNSRVIDNTHVKHPDKDKVRFATYNNKNRAVINAEVFRDHLEKYHGNCDETNIPKSAIVIRAGAEWCMRKQKLSFRQREILYKYCCEAHCKDSMKKRCDPLLCLFHGCHVMGTQNSDVKNGIANGTTSTFQKIIFKDGKSPKPMKMHGKWVYGIDIEDVDHLVLEWYKCKFKGTFKVHPTSGNFKVQYPISEPGFHSGRMGSDIHFTYLPININFATTGHKLQGKSLDELVIAQWSKEKNWAYVVLSRVRTIDGLYLLEEIPSDIDFLPDPQYLAMMERLRTKLLATTQNVQTLLEDFDITKYLIEITT